MSATSARHPDPRPAPPRPRPACGSAAGWPAWTGQFVWSPTDPLECVASAGADESAEFERYGLEHDLWESDADGRAAGAEKWACKLERRRARESRIGGGR